MSIIAGGKDSKLNFCFHRKHRTPWSIGLVCACLRAGTRVGVLIAVPEFGNSERYKIGFPEGGLILYPWGTFVTMKKKNKISGWFYTVGLPVTQAQAAHGITLFL